MSDWKKFDQELDRGTLSAAWGLGKLFAVFGVMGVLVLVIIMVVWKPFDIISTVTQTDRMIYNYEYFYNQAEAKRAIERKIDAAERSVERFVDAAGDRTGWTFEDKTEYARLTSIYDGLLYQCNDLVADYNAKAQQVTRSIFKTDSTPYRLTECN